MPPKPRPHGKPKPKPPSPADDRRRLLTLGLGGVALLAAVATALAFTLGGGGDAPGDARAALEAAGCTLTAEPALESADHSITDPSKTSDLWNTDPPTSGPHYEVPVVWGSYDDPVNQAQLVHNLEHGGIGVQYGEGVSPATVEQVKSFVQANSRGTVLAPMPGLGDQIALTAWVTKSPSEPRVGTGYVAKCAAFDEGAFDAFFDAYQFRGPERFPADALLPGHT